MTDLPAPEALGGLVLVVHTINGEVKGKLTRITYRRDGSLRSLWLNPIAGRGQDRVVLPWRHITSIIVPSRMRRKGK